MESCIGLGHLGASAMLLCYISKGQLVFVSRLVIWSNLDKIFIIECWITFYWWVSATCLMTGVKLNNSCLLVS